MKRVTATMIGIFQICHRELWLHANGINMENSTENRYVEEGNLISETTYLQRSNRWRELAFDNVKIDFFDHKEKIVREVKKSPKLKNAHIAQVQYYLYRLKMNGVINCSGIIEYPKQKKTLEVKSLTEIDCQTIERWVKEILAIINNDHCPSLVEKPFCRSCSFREFCFVNE